MPSNFDPKTGKFPLGVECVCSLDDWSTWEIVAQARVSDYVYLVEPNYIWRLGTSIRSKIYRLN